MSHLRHPVVITSLEEDFRKIGLLKEARREDQNFEQDLEEAYSVSKEGGPTGTGSPGKNTHAEGDPESLRMGYKPGGDRLNRQSDARKHAALDYGQESDDSDEDEDRMSEAAAFAEEFAEEWAAMGEESEFDMDEDDMEELEGFAEEIVELPGEYLGEAGYDDEDEDEDEEDGADESVNEGIAGAMARISAIVESVSDRPSVEEAIPAFANVALIAEMLASFFNSDGLQEDEGLEGASETFAEMAVTAAETVRFLQDEDEDEVNLRAVEGTLKEYVEMLLQGLEAYAALTEDEDEDEDDDLGEGDDLGND